MSKYKLTLIIIIVLFPVVSFAGISEILELRAQSKAGSIEVSWQKPNLAETESILLVRKEESCPKNSSEGEEIYRGNGSSFEDKRVENGRKYCYGAFVYDASGRISELNFSGVVEKRSWLANILGAIFNDYVIFGGVGLIIVLFWVDRNNFLMWREPRIKRGLNRTRIER